MRRLAMVVGWMALVAATASMGAFAVTSRSELATAGVGFAVVAMISSGLMPEPRSRRRRTRFAPLEDLRAARREPSLARRLLTLP